MHKKSFALLVAGAALLTDLNSAYAASKLEQVMDPEMLSADLAYFERITGPARNTQGDQKTYKVDSCEVTATVGGGVVSTLRMTLSDKCSFNLNKFLHNANPALPKKNLTFGQFDKSMSGDGVYLSDCLSMCGNAYDPSVYQYWEGSHADGFINVLLEVVLVDDKAINAADQWKDAMVAAKGDDWVMEGKFNCEPNAFNETAHAAFERIRVSAVTIGSELVKPGC